MGCLIIAGAAFQTWRFEQTALTFHTNEDRLTRQFSSLTMAVSDVRAAQAAYVAAGQGPEFWFARVDEIGVQMDELFAEVERIGHTDALASVTGAKAQLAAFRVSDGRARNYVRNEQLLLASDVIFVESLDILGRLAAEVATARDIEIQTHRQQTTKLRQFQAGLGGGALVLLLGLVVMVGRQRPTTPEQVVPTVQPQPEVKIQRVEVQGPAPMKVTETADVCVDIARLLDGRDLPGLLARASSAIGAKGLVLWIIDEAGSTLHPSLSHGYSERMVQRLGTLAVSADNVTSVACRTLQSQILPGALAVPLVGTAGCVGVLAAEVPMDANSNATLPLARVIAAQLAAVIRPQAMPSTSTAEAL